MTQAQALSATADIRTRHGLAVAANRAARRDLAAARRRVRETAQIRDALEGEARRLGLELVVTPQP